MNNLLWFLRASQWARNPPSARRVKLVLFVILVIVAIVVLEKLGWWPEWAQMERGRRAVMPR